MESSTPARRKTICVVDDDHQLNHMISKTLRSHGYEVLSFSTAIEFLQWHESGTRCYDLIVSDFTMPQMSGHELCKIIRALPQTTRVPFIIITGNDHLYEKSAGLEVGADDFIQKPFRIREFLAKIQSLLDIRDQDQERLVRLTRFVSPNVANLVIHDEKRAMLEPHEADVTVVFFDLRGFTAFSEKFSPTDVLEVLNEYYTVVGNATIHHHGTLGHLAGDGIMVFFNDPEPIADHQEAAVRMALEARTGLIEKRTLWQNKGYNIDFGIGLAEGHATIGGIGFDQFWQYSVIGPVANFASRICQVANHGQILMSHRFRMRMNKEGCAAESLGTRPIKGIQPPVSVFNVLSMDSSDLSSKVS